MKKLLKSPRVMLLVIFLVLALVSIYSFPPGFIREGVAIRSVMLNSSADLAGMENPKPNSPPLSREYITSVNNVPVKDIDGYYGQLLLLAANDSVNIESNKKNYYLKVDENKTLGLGVYNVPRTNIRKGLDLEGGTRVLLQPLEELNPTDRGFLLDSMRQRLNVYGLSDLVIREAADLPPPLGTGNQYIVVEIAGATQEEVRNLLAQQGKFEAKIGNESVFKGGDDIRSVCRSANCAGIDPQYGCRQSGIDWVCSFRFSITLSQAAAERQAALTQTLSVITESDNQRYLEKPLLLYLDDQEVDKLNIGADLKGRAVTDIQISGSGIGQTQQQAAFNALQNMKQLQTLLITGSLPVKIDIVKMDTMSPVLGSEFVKNAFIVGLLAILCIGVIIFFRYRKLVISLSIIFTMVCETILLLGMAAVIGWNIDLSAIAGIILAIGTGVNHQIVITDETYSREEKTYSWKTRLKRALFIIMAAYATTLVAMVPLMFAGAGLLKGFAITAIIGEGIGVFITRPAYASIIEILLKNEN